ncbi:Uncharacterised protein [Serratia entomophila]|nr:Uncharacterised protein [Serratia entomophila]
MHRKNLNFYFSRIIEDAGSYDNPTSGKYEISQRDDGARMFAPRREDYFFLIGRPDQYPASSEPERLCQTENSAPGSAASGEK